MSSRTDDFILLRRRPYRDGKDLVDGIGRLGGRLSAVVHGSRKKGGGVLEPPVRLQARFREGPSLDTLTQPVLKDAYSPLRRDLSRLMTAGFLSRLFLVAVPERAAEDEVFDLLVELLEGLARGVSPRVCGLAGQERLLGVLGVAPEIELCVRCGSPEVAGFSPPDGGVLCADCYQGAGFAVTEGALHLSRELRSGSLSELGDPESETDLRILGRMYKEQFGAHLGVGADYFKRVLPEVGA